MMVDDHYHLAGYSFPSRVRVEVTLSVIQTLNFKLPSPLPSMMLYSRINLGAVTRRGAAEA
jgi:hypothetical protein